MSISTNELTKRFRQVQLLLTDVDGVLTDGGVYVGSCGEMKCFNTQDGLGMALLRRSGIQLGWISSRPSPATSVRAAELKIEFLSQEKISKTDAVEAILAKTHLTYNEVCFVGDDLVDLPVLRKAGAAVAVANAVAEVKAAAHYVTQASGGHGAVRETVELILKAQGKWEKIVSDY